MEIDKLFENNSIDNVADNVFGVVNNSVSEVREMQRKKVAENVQLVVNALKKIEEDIREKYDSVSGNLEKRIISIKDGRDGINGRDGKDGKDGKQGKEGRPGRDGKDGKNGLNGVDGQDGVSVVNAHIDFDGSLIISLSSGKEINVGEVVAPALAEQIKVITNGGGTSQSVLDTLTSLQSQIDALSGATIYKGLWNASTNSPSLTSSVGTSGNFYIVSVAGSTSLDGITNWDVGDWAIFNGSVWQRVEGGAAGNFTTLSASGVATFSAGSAAAPAITTSGDTNTGIFFPAADTIAFTEGGAEAMRINSSGNVGIGTTSPSATDRLTIGDGAVANNASISINGGSNNARGTGIKFSKAGTAVGFIGSASWLEGGTSDALAFSANSSATVAMRIDSSGNVGIGVTPTTKLDVSGTSRYTFNVANAYTLQTSLNAAGSAFADDYKNALSHIWQTSGTERMRIDSSGNVGIGTSSLTGYSLRVGKTVTGAVDSVGVLSNGLVQSDVTSSAAQLQAQIGLAASAFTLSNAFGLYVGQTALSGGAAITSQYGVYVANSLTGATNNYGFYSNIASGSNRYNFYANGTADNYFAGNVGIGTSSPGGKLHAVVTDASTVLKLERTGAGATSYTADFSGATFNQSISAGADFVWIEGGAEWMRLTNAGNVGIGTASPTAKLDVSSDVFRLRTAKTPASASATGNAGDICWDSSYIYVCTATNTWKRVAIATW